MTEFCKHGNKNGYCDDCASDEMVAYENRAVVVMPSQIRELHLIDEQGMPFHIFRADFDVKQEGDVLKIWLGEFSK